MRALRFYGVGDLRLDEIPRPEPDPGDVLVQIEVALTDGTDPGIIATLSARLQAWTGERWLVNVSNKAPEGKTVREERVAREQAAHAQAHEDPLVQAILETFPGAKVVNVKLRDDAVVATPEAIAPVEPEEDDE